MNATIDTSWRGIVAAFMVAVLSVAGLLIVRSDDGAAASSTAGSVSGPHASGTSPLANLAETDPQRRVEVIFQLASGTNAAAGRDLIQGAGGDVTRNLPIINGVGARLDAADAQRLSSNPAFHAVSLNAKVGSDVVDQLQQVERAAATASSAASG